MKMNYKFYPVSKQVAACKCVNGYKWNMDAKTFYTIMWK